VARKRAMAMIGVSPPTTDARSGRFNRWMSSSGKSLNRGTWYFEKWASRSPCGQDPDFISFSCLVAMPTGRSTGMPAQARSVVSRSP